jgi:hypothetical protein
MTWSALIETTSIQSHETALFYVQQLEDAFLVRILYAASQKSLAGTCGGSASIWPF